VALVVVVQVFLLMGLLELPYLVKETLVATVTQIVTSRVVVVVELLPLVFQLLSLPQTEELV
jgi:hypothetical protein